MANQTATQDDTQRIQLLNEQNRRLDQTAKMLIQQDLELRQAYDRLEKAFEEVNREKEKVSAERNKLQVVLAGINDAVITVDYNRRVSVFNKAAEKITGHRAEEVLNKPIYAFLSLFEGATLLDPSIYCPLSKDDFEGTVYFHENVKLVTKYTKETYVNLSVGKIKESAFANVACIITLHDVTYDKQLEQMKLDFVSMAAHELRTPLTAINGYLSIFFHESEDTLSEAQLRNLKRIKISSDQLIALVENLLNVSRIEQKSLTINKAPTDWITTVDEAVQQLTNRALEKNITLTFTKPNAQYPPVMVDTLRICEVLNNLLANAINYTANHGMVTVTLEKKDDKVITHIADTGQGIPKDALPHLFTKFFRVSGKLEQGSKGTGLGLYISKAIVEMHNGTIWVDSELNKGSTFSFALPIVTT